MRNDDNDGKKGEGEWGVEVTLMKQFMCTTLAPSCLC